MMERFDCARITEVADLRAAILALPRAAKAQLRLGPQAPEPACGVCSALHAGGLCHHPIEDYHEVGVFDFAALLGEDDMGKVAEMVTDEAEPLVRALAGALAAERSLTCYLLAGWRPQDQVRHARAALAQATASSGERSDA